MDLNIDIKDIKGQIQELLGKFSKSPSANSEGASSTPENNKKPSADLKKITKPLTNFLGKYSYNRETILGVDLSPHYVRVCQMKSSYDQWMLSNLASSCMENQFRKSDIREFSDLYVENLKDLIEKNGIKTKDVAFSLPTSSSIVKVVRVPQMDEEDFAQAAAMGSIWEGMVALDGGISEYSVYYKIIRHNPEAVIEEVPAEVSPEQAVETIEKPLEQVAENLQEQAVIQEAVQTENEGVMPASEGAPAMEAVVISENVEQVPVLEPSSEVDEALSSVPTEDEIVQQEVAAVTETNEPIVQAEEISEENLVESVMPEVAGEVPVEAITTEEVVMQPNPEIAPEAEANVEAPVVEALEEIQPDLAITPDVPVEGAEPAMDMAVAPAEPEALSGPTMDVLFVASKIADINLHADIIRRAGLNPVLADVGCLSLKHAIETGKKNFDEVREPYAFMEFGPDENHVYIADGYNTDVYSVFVSDDDKNNIIYNAADVDKVNEFARNYASQVVQILDQHKSQYKTQTINHVFVSSSAPLHVDDASVEPLIKIFVREASKSLVGRKVSECNFLSHIIVPEKFAKKVNAEGDISAWAGTVGIASRKLDIFGYEEQEGKPAINMVNLLPGSNDNKKAQRVSIISTLCFAAVFAFVMLQIGISYMSITSKSGALAGEIKNMDGVESTYNIKMGEAQKLSLIMNQVNSLDDVKESLPSNQGSILSAYKHITSVIPEGIWLDEVNYMVPAGIEIKGSSINDSNILNFVNKLNEGKEFEAIALKEMEMKKSSGQDDTENPLGGPIKKFTLEGNIKENVSMQGLEMLSNGDNSNGN